MSTYIHNRGFTIIELMAVVAIISVLGSIVYAAVTDQIRAAEDARRREDLVKLELALQAYREFVGSFPDTSDSWQGTSNNGGNYDVWGSNAYVPGLVPTFLEQLPGEFTGLSTEWAGYNYRSDGVQFKLTIHTTPNEYPASGERFYDPVRPTTAWMICEGSTACTTW